MTFLSQTTQQRFWLLIDNDMNRDIVPPRIVTDSMTGSHVEYKFIAFDSEFS